MRPIFSSASVLILVGTAFLLSNCSAPKTVSTSTPSTRYSEDLSALRPSTVTEEKPVVTEPADQKKPTTYVEPKFAVTKQLDAVLDSIDRIHLNRKAIDGFTIQVYSGRREEALNAKKTLTTTLPDLDSEIQFTEPIFRVKVGKYYTRQEAQEDYSDIKRYFPAAIIIPEKIAIR
jgi:hypothetical protein